MTHPSPRWARRLRRSGALALSAALLAALPLTAHPAAAAGAAGRAPADDPAPTRADVYRALHLEQEPADYVILVDTSGSMTEDGRYDTVVSTLHPFLAGLTPKDHVALFTFDSRPEARYIGSAGDPDAIIAHLPAGPDPSGSTDIGAALDSALTELERDDASPVASVVLLTDGKQEPPDSSRYPADPAKGDWPQLHDRAGKVAAHHELAGYALPLGSGASGADLLGAVVPHTAVLRPDSIQNLGAYLARAGDRTRARQAGRLLAPDDGKGVTARWEGGTADVTGGSAGGRITLTSQTGRLPLTVTGLHASLAGSPVTVSGLPDRVVLQPGRSVSYQVTLHGTLPAGFLPYRTGKDEDARLRLSGTVGSPWAQPLAPDVALHVPGRVAVDADTVPLHAEVGSAAFLPGAAGAVVLLALLGWLWWRRVNRPPMTGTLVVARVFGEQLPDRVALAGRRPLRLDPPGAGGRGTVHGRRRRKDGAARTELVVRYTPDGTSARESGATCEPGGQVVVGGVQFTHVPARETSGRTPEPGPVR